MKLSKINTISFCILLALASCKNREKPVNTDNIITDSSPKFKKEGELSFMRGDSLIKKIDLEIADNNGEREQGLMNRPWMEENQGMLFIFDKSEPQSFWMKNTIMPLDIIFINENMQILNVAKDCQPYSEKNIRSAGNAKYVVEVISGFSEKFGVRGGDKIQFTRNPSL